MRGSLLLVTLSLFASLSVSQITGGGVVGDSRRVINDITFYLNDFLDGVGPCACGQSLNETYVASGVARMAERCERENAGDADWVFANGGYASLPDYGFQLSRQQIAYIFAAVSFGPCQVFYQVGYNYTIHSAWRRVYTCGGRAYSGVESVETVYDPLTNLVTWNWISLEPYWSGLNDCLSQTFPWIPAQP